ncbi:MAG TPA: hypothetical protein VGW35_05335 [Methylomirabilota bacterium]|nr:hypothetical protein [Methylomirabilota bacterium]
MPPRIFLLSPADCAGERARLVMSPRALFPLAARLRASGAPLGEVMAFMSGLYFRGKLAYARVFARPAEGILVITPNAGLVSADQVVTVKELRRFARGDVRVERADYRRPLVAAAEALAGVLPPAGEVVLLGSIATDKYTGPLAPIFGPRLLYPRVFTGLGDMSRGALLLRAVRAGVELEYAAVQPSAGGPAARVRPARG